MPRYSYTAWDAHGALQTGQLEAVDVKQVAAILHGQGLFPTEVRAASSPERMVARDPRPRFEPARRLGSTPGERNSPDQGLRRVFQLPVVRVAGKRELSAFTRQLATLLRAGMPLLRGLELLARQEQNARFRPVIEALAEAIRSGGTLSDAMGQHAQVFDRLYRNMIRAGEAGGVLEVVLDRLACFQEKSLQLRGKITAAMVYPLIVLAVAVIIVSGLLVFVVPKFQQIFADLLKGAPLPALTHYVLTLSGALRSNLPAVLGVMAALAIGLGVIRRTPAGERLIDTLALRGPLIGGLVLKVVVARFSRTLGTLLASGVPILPGLLITRDTCGNFRVQAALTEVHDRVKEGAPIAGTLAATRVFPPMVTGLIEVGEQAGQLPEMLGKLADIYEAEVDNAVAGLSSLLEPLLILFLAVVVGTVVIALFLPIIRIVQLLS